MKRIFKGLLLVLAFAVVTPLVVAAFLPRRFVLDREVVVDRPNDRVFDFVRKMENQKAYSVWTRIDPGVKTRLKGTDGDVGAVFSWESSDQNVGTGEQEILAVRPGERVDFQVRMSEPFQSTDPVTTFTESVGPGRTKVRSVYQGKANYPFNLICPLICKKVGDDMQQSLQNLKAVLERPAAVTP